MFRSTASPPFSSSTSSISNSTASSSPSSFICSCCCCWRGPWLLLPSGSYGSSDHHQWRLLQANISALVSTLALLRFPLKQNFSSALLASPLSPSVASCITCIFFSWTPISISLSSPSVQVDWSCICSSSILCSRWLHRPPCLSCCCLDWTMAVQRGSSASPSPTNFNFR